jgi:hypothetical protein
MKEEKLSKLFDLTEISCYAAGEIDSYVLKKDKGFEAVKELASRIKRFSKERYKEPTWCMIFYDTLKKYSDREVSQLDDLSFKTYLLAKDLESVESLSKPKLELLRSFCISLSNEACRYENPFLGRMIA